ncbi:hypothetical protein trd_A0264 (plasmid) [Thermomicrobium roseum DSM 5159]|uniref:Uncharacterized protein n=1 Tax=Thermomicrobium roseum (strain ATCC 27502 / DSM 5159 / P-2) TaxID=309801 RepID=B9L3A0_THERP|nr:hypothetical protein trd_A0264 [Thermomicrobium roseum DSM 5159]
MAAIDSTTAGAGLGNRCVREQAVPGQHGALVAGVRGE